VAHVGEEHGLGAIRFLGARPRDLGGLARGFQLRVLVAQFVRALRDHVLQRLVLGADPGQSPAQQGLHQQECRDQVTEVGPRRAVPGRQDAKCERLRRADRAFPIPRPHLQAIAAFVQVGVFAEILAAPGRPVAVVAVEACLVDQPIAAVEMRRRELEAQGVRGEWQIDWRERSAAVVQRCAIVPGRDSTQQGAKPGRRGGTDAGIESEQAIRAAGPDDAIVFREHLFDPATGRRGQGLRRPRPSGAGRPGEASFFQTTGFIHRGQPQRLRLAATHAIDHPTLRLAEQPGEAGVRFEAACVRVEAHQAVMRGDQQRVIDVLHVVVVQLRQPVRFAVSCLFRNVHLAAGIGLESQPGHAVIPGADPEPAVGFFQHRVHGEVDVRHAARVDPLPALVAQDGDAIPEPDIDTAGHDPRGEQGGGGAGDATLQLGDEVAADQEGAVVVADQQVVTDREKCKRLATQAGDRGEAGIRAGLKPEHALCGAGMQHVAMPMQRQHGAIEAAALVEAAQRQVGFNTAQTTVEREPQSAWRSTNMARTVLSCSPRDLSRRPRRRASASRK
jgi:hypothetical protein